MLILEDSLYVLKDTEFPGLRVEYRTAEFERAAPGGVPKHGQVPMDVMHNERVPRPLHATLFRAGGKVPAP